MSLVNVETGVIADDDTTINYKIHPVAALFPYISGEAFDDFVEDIRKHGQREPVVLDSTGRLLDGRNRARACAVLGVDVNEIRYSGDDATSWIISHNVHRRHLTESQRAMVAARLSDLRRGGDRGNQHVGGKRSSDLLPTGITRQQAADQLNVGTASVGRAKVVLKSGDTDLIKAVDAGDIPVTTAAKRVRATKAASEPSKQPSRSRLQKAEKLEDLAAQGYSSRQMCKALDYARDDQVRELAREFNIEIPADRSVGRTRRINSTHLVENTATALEGLVMGIELIQYEEVDPAVASQWADSLTESMRALNRFVRQITKE